MRVVDYRDCDPIEWDRLALGYGWFWHSTLWRDYTIAYAGSAADIGIMDGDELIAIAPIPAHGPAWAPAVRGAMDKTYSTALEMCFKARRIQLSPLVPDFPHRLIDFAALTTRHGYRDISLTTRVIDLTRPEDHLLRDMSKGHRSAIKRSGHIITRIAADDASFATYRDLHRRACGTVTRPGETFDEMWHWITLGNAGLVIAEIDGEPVGATLLIVYGNSAAYSSTATAPERNRDTIGHAMMWTAIRWLKAQGLRRFELGTQYRGLLAYDRSTAKDLNISLYKRGFGGIEMPLMIREHPIRRSTHGAIRSTGKAARRPTVATGDLR